MKRPLAILWYKWCVWGFHFKVHRVCGNPPLVTRVTKKKCLIRRGLMLFFFCQKIVFNPNLKTLNTYRFAPSTCAFSTILQYTGWFKNTLTFLFAIFLHVPNFFVKILLISANNVVSSVFPENDNENDRIVLKLQLFKKWRNLIFVHEYVHGHWAVVLRLIFNVLMY